MAAVACGCAIRQAFAQDAAAAAPAAELATAAEEAVSAAATVACDPTKHRYVFLVDVNKCIGCGECVRACETENDVPPQFTSAMAAFGLIYALYLTLVVIEIWLVYRKEIILTAARSRGLKRLVFKILAVGIYDISDEAMRVDRRVIMVLAALGIPAACILHGYVGFMFGSVKANHWWSTPLMPIIFLFSAVTSGIAMVIILFMSISRLNQRPIEGDCVQALSRWLWLFTILTVTIEQLEIVTLAYKQGEEWPLSARC